MNINVNNSNSLIKALGTESKEKISITIESGIYEINETLNLKDNVELLGKGNVVLKGTKRISLADEKSENGRIVIDLNKFGITEVEQFPLGPYSDFWEECDIPKPHMTEFSPSFELYFDDKKMNISKYPQDDYIYIEKAVGKTRVDAMFEKKEGGSEGLFVPSETRIFDNNDTDNMLLVGYWCYNWASQRHIIKSYDADQKIIEVDEPNHVFGYMDKAKFEHDRGKFYILNLLSEVKNPGDWYIDRKTCKLYLIPFEGQEYVDVALCENMFEAENAENIAIKNILAEGCRRSAFNFSGCKNVSIENCSMRNLGAWGAILDRCSNSMVSDCNVYNVGGGGIAMSGGDRNTLTKSGNVVKSNTIHDIAYWHKTYLAGIEISGVGVTVAENKIYDVPHFAIVFQGNEHIIEKNCIQNACYDSNDAGAIYAGRDWTCRGNIIRYNLIRDLPACNGQGCVGIYFDDAMSSAEVYGNILVNLPFAGIMIGGGRDFDIHHNCFYDCNVALHFDNRIVGDGGYMYGRLTKHLAEVPYRSEVWKNAYPGLYVLMDDECRQPKNNKFHNNTVVGGNGIAMLHDKSVTQHLTHYDNIYIRKGNMKLHHIYDENTLMLADEM